MEQLIRTRARAIVLVFAAVAVLCGPAALRVRIDTSVENLLIKGDPDRTLNREIKTEFSNDEVILVGFELDQPFSAADLRKLDRISEAIAELPHVEEVIDLSNVEDVRSRGDELDASHLIDLETLDENFPRIRERVRDHRLYRGNLVSDELDVLALVALLFPESSPEEGQATSATVLELVGHLAPPWRVYVSGYPVVALEANRLVRRDLALLTVTALVVIGLILYATFRRAFVVCLLGALVGWTELVALAWLGLSDTPLSVVTSGLPTILVATASTYVVYLVSLLEKVAERPEPGPHLVRLLARPVALSGISTAIGFLSLRFIEVQAIGEVGTALAVGVAGSVLGTLLLLPALIHIFDLRLHSERSKRMEAWSLWGVRLARRPWLPVAVAAVLLALVLPGTLRVVVDTDIEQYFPTDHPVRIDGAFLEESLSGPFIINVVVRTPHEGGALEPRLLAFTDALLGELEQDPIVQRTLSFLDYVYLMDAALRPGEEPRTVLSSRQEAAQYLLLYEAGGDPGDYRHYINHDRSALNLLVYNDSGTRANLAFARRIRAFARSAPPGTSVHVLGSAFLFSKAMDPIARGVTVGLLSALVLIVGVIALVLRSLRLALAAAVPNAIPILVAAGLLGWLGVPLSMGTSIVGCVVLGLAVDDTAHVIGHLRRGEPFEGVYRLVGRALVVTTLALGLGFGCLMLSGFQTVFILGAGTTLTLVLALACDLWLLPSLLKLIGYDPSPAQDRPIPLPSTSHREPRAAYGGR